MCHWPAKDKESAIYYLYSIFKIGSNDCELQVEAHHFCACPNEDVRQCVIYDSDKPNARLIGTEYIISDKLFETLPEEEKVYWHSHKYEVQSGTLQVCISVALACHALPAKLLML